MFVLGFLSQVLHYNAIALLNGQRSAVISTYERAMLCTECSVLRRCQVRIVICFDKELKTNCYLHSPGIILLK